MLAPCGAKTGAISVVVDVNLCICVCVCIVHIGSCSCASPVYVFVHCVRVFLGEDTMKWVAERAPPTIKELNGQPKVPVRV